MPYLRLNNGTTIYTGGKYRVIKEADGLYVVGYGFCMPVLDRAEGDRLVIELTSLREGR